MIIVSIATIRNRTRLSYLNGMLYLLLSQTTPPNKIFVYLESYDTIPPLLPRYPNIYYMITPNATGGLSSYQVIGAIPDSIYISLDDDLTFPNTFINDIIFHLHYTGKNSALSYLSKYYPKLSNYTPYEKYTSTHFSTSTEMYLPCHILGSGISIFHSSYMGDCYKFITKTPLPGIYRDMLVSYYLWLKGVTVLRPPCRPGLIHGLECAENCNSRKPLAQRRYYFNMLRKLGFLQKPTFGSLK